MTLPIRYLTQEVAGSVPTSSTATHPFVASIVITPLALLGGVFYSADALDEPWATLTRIDPLYYLVDATRGGLTGFHESPIWISLLVAAGIAAAAFAAATALIRSGWRLKA